ncbi:MAG: hypothetical protein K0S86_4952 [Geminicoccaceae bacterium]|nr:hypothetical protein [Geminicoccaceae bacterium]
MDRMTKMTRASSTVALASGPRKRGNGPPGCHAAPQAVPDSRQSHPVVFTLIRVIVVPTGRGAPDRTGAGRSPCSDQHQLS